jgi:hypothetical protein
MTTPPTNRSKHHRFPTGIISHGVWLHFRFDRDATSSPLLSTVKKWGTDSTLGRK